MSSWLGRVAGRYGMDLRDLVRHDLGHTEAMDLDMAPPESLLSEITRRSGVAMDRLRGMSLAGWVPWVLDDLDDRIPDAFETYARQCSVLLPPRARRAVSVTRWRAWLPIVPSHQFCPDCLDDPAGQAVLLAWKMPLMLSCPLHGCRLESHEIKSGHQCEWGDAPRSTRTANDAIVALDQHTWHALTMGYVDLPRRRVHAGLWFRVLRALLDELNTPLTRCEAHGGHVRHVWERCGLPLRAGQTQWKPYEILDLPLQMQTLEAAATAIAMIERKDISPCGEHAELFRAEPRANFSNGLPMKECKQESSAHWTDAETALYEAVVEALDEARFDPKSARSLFALASYGRRDPESLERLRAEFAKDGIPSEFVSHYIPEEPFAFLRKRDG